MKIENMLNYEANLSEYALHRRFCETNVYIVTFRNWSFIYIPFSSYSHILQSYRVSGKKGKKIGKKIKID